MTILEASRPAFDINALEGRVHSWEMVTGQDGPGTRLVTWLSGCALRCLYCHNPDTWKLRDGELTTVAELAVHMARFARFLTASGGGITVSGGEPLMQPTFTAALLRRAKELDLHTALDTSGFLGSFARDSMLDDIDLVLLDIKSSDPATYHKTTGRTLEPTLRFARRLAERGDRVWVRFVLVPGLTNAPANVAGVARIAAELGNVERVEVLPYHSMGRYKFEQLGLRYELDGTEPPSEFELERTRDVFRDAGLTTY